MQIELSKDEISMVYNSISARLLYYKDNIKKLSEEIDKVEAGTLVFFENTKEEYLAKVNKKLSFYQDFCSRYTAFISRIKPIFDKVRSDN